MFELRVDNRERSAIPHLDVELKDIKYSVSNLQVADYAIIKSTPLTNTHVTPVVDRAQAESLRVAPLEFQEESAEVPDDLPAELPPPIIKEDIVAVFERKTYEDFAASFKDGRYDNKEKMLNLRSVCGCKVFFIIEGRAYPDPSKRFGRIPYIAIESSIFHLMVRDNIHVIYTRDTLHTIQVLKRFIKSMETLDKKGDLKLGGEDAIVVAPESSPVDMLTTRAKKPDLSVLRELWSCFKGITMDSADTFARYATVAEILTGFVSAEDIAKFKSASGKSISARTANSLINVPKAIKVKLLAVIPGISRNTSTKLNETYNIKKLITMGVEQLSTIEIHEGKSTKKLGPKVAENIKKYLNMKLTPEGDLAQISEEPILKVCAEAMTKKPRRVKSGGQTPPDKPAPKPRRRNAARAPLGINEKPSEVAVAHQQGPQ